MKTFQLVGLVCCILLPGCALLGIDDCEGARTAYETTFSIQFLDLNGTQSIFVAPLNYQQDSVRIFDEQGKPVPHVLQTDPANLTVDFPLLISEKAPPTKTLLTQQFIVYFTRADQDTIRAEYELLKNDCNELDFKKLVVFYNNQKVQEGDGRYTIQLKIRKP